MVCRLLVSSSVINLRASSVADRRTPMVPSTSGGFQNHSRRAARGCAVAIDELDLALEQLLGELARVGDGGAAGDDRGVAAVEPAQPQQAAQHVGEVRAEQPAVGVQLVDDDVAQVLEEADPAGVVRQDAAVQHVGVGDHDVAVGAHRPAQAGRGVAVVGGGAQALGEVDGDVLEPGELVLGQRLGGEQPQRARVGVVQPGVEDRDCERQRLAAGRRRHHDHVATPERVLHRLRLVDVGTVDAALGERGDQPRVELRRPLRVLGATSAGISSSWTIRPSTVALARSRARASATGSRTVATVAEV